MLKKLFLLVAALLPVVIASGCKGNSGEERQSIQHLPLNTCSQSSKNFVARVYACTYSYPESYDQCLAAAGNSQMSSQWVQCASALTVMLRQTAQALAPSPKQTDALADLGLRYGATDQALSLINEQQAPGQLYLMLADQIGNSSALAYDLITGNRQSAFSGILTMPAMNWRQLSSMYPSASIKSERQRLYSVNYSIIMALFQNFGM